MRRLWIWLLPIALAATTFGSLAREPLAIRLLVLAALTLAVDTAAWRTWPGGSPAASPSCPSTTWWRR